MRRFILAILLAIAAQPAQANAVGMLQNSAAKSSCQKLQAKTNPEAALKIYEDLLPNLEDTLC